jgi:hypothetical protein
MNERADLIAKAGEWVTTQGGKKVCRVAKAIRTYDPPMPGQFVNWQDGFPEPIFGDPMPLDAADPWVRPAPGGGLQLHVDGEWRP